MTASFGTSHAATMKKWNNKIFTEYQLGMLLSPLMGTSDKAVIQVDPEAETSNGDVFKFHFRPQLGRTTGVTGSNQLKGNEQDLTIYVDEITIDEVANAVTIRNVDISNKRTVVDLSDQQFMALEDWLIERAHYDLLSAMIDTSTGRTQARYLYGSLDSNYNATEATAKGNVDDTDDRLSPDMLVKAKNKAQLEGNAKVRPANVSSREDYPVEQFVFLGHTYAINHLTNHPKWSNMTYHDVIASSLKTEGAMYRGSYEGVAVYEIPDSLLLETGAGAGSIDITHGLLLGAQAVAVGFGMQPEFRPDDEDYGRMRNLGVIEIRGEKKVVFNSEDFATVHVYASGTNA